MAYPLSTLVELTGTFTDSTGSLVDPGVVTLYYEAPKQVQPTAVTAPDVARVSPGVYAFRLLLNKPGTWTYSWVGTGTMNAASYDVPLVVAPSKLHS